MELKDLRTRMDEINAQMLALFVERMNLSLDIAKYKLENGLPVLDKARERSILNRMALEAGEPLEDYTQVLFRTLFELSRSYQSGVIQHHNALADRIKEAIDSTPALFPRRAVVACQGVEGAYSQQACDKLFPHAEIVYVQSFEGVFQAVEKGLCRYGVLPIENSSFGSVGTVYDLMKRHKFSIVRGTRLRIVHALLGKKGASLDGIREVFSHEQAIGQCGEFLKAHPKMKVTVCANTAMAAKMVAESDRSDVAAISSQQCAELYDLQLLLEGIQDSDSNFTRFICISRALEIYPGASKISLMMTLPHSPGSLSGLLSRFSMLGINLTKLESRPMPGKEFEFMFYFDLEGSVSSEPVLKLLCELQNNPGTFVFLGNYIDA